MSDRTFNHFIPASRLLSSEAETLRGQKPPILLFLVIPIRILSGFAGIASGLALLWYFPSLGFAFVAGLTLFADYESPLLKNVEEHLLVAGQRLGMSDKDLVATVEPKRQVHTRFRFRLDNGNLSDWIDAWRFVMDEPGKGGIRAEKKAVAGDILALTQDMDGKPSSKMAIEGHPLRGGKGGSPVDLEKLSVPEKVRWMRGWVRTIMENRWYGEHRVAFGPLFDSTAPDIGTSPQGLNLMDYFSDEVNRWLLEHADEVLPWLNRKDPRLAHDLRRLQESAAREAISFSEEGPQMELHYVERIIHLRQTNDLSSLRLLACVTGKTAPNKDLPLGHGGIRGRTEATGRVLAYGVLKWWQLLGVIPETQATLENKTVIVEGFGNVGYWAAVTFAQLRARVQAIAEYDQSSKTEIVFYCAAGFSLEALEATAAYKKRHETLIGFEETVEAQSYGILRINKDAFWRLDVDLVAPCARQNTMTSEAADVLGARYVAEGANGPTTAAADHVLDQRKIPRLPDMVANAGGVITSYLEILQDIEENGQPWTLDDVNRRAQEIMNERITEIFEQSRKSTISMREAVIEHTLLIRRAGLSMTSSSVRRLTHWTGALKEINPFLRWRLMFRNGVRLLHYPPRAFYMVTQKNFRLIDELNVHMDMTKQPDPVIAAEQSRKLQNRLRRMGAEIIVDAGADHVPDQVFTANAGLAFEINGLKYFIASKFKEHARRGETELFEAAFERRGYTVIRGLFDEDEFWEGEGDMLEHEGVLYGAWYNPQEKWSRSHKSAHQKVAKAIGLPLVELHLVDPRFYHLDTAIAFLDENTAMAYMPAFDEESRRELEKRFYRAGKTLIRLSEEDAELFAPNAIVYGRHIVLSTVSDELVAELTAQKFEVERTPMSEFRRSGGATKCSVLNMPAFQLYTWPRWFRHGNEIRPKADRATLSAA